MDRPDRTWSLTSLTSLYNGWFHYGCIRVTWKSSNPLRLLFKTYSTLHPSLSLWRRCSLSLPGVVRCAWAGRSGAFRCCIIHTKLTTLIKPWREARGGSRRETQTGYYEDFWYRPQLPHETHPISAPNSFFKMHIVAPLGIWHELWCPHWHWRC